jgi:hypothetical protein
MPRSNAAAPSPALLSHCSSLVFRPSCSVFGTLTKVAIAHFPLTSTPGEAFVPLPRGAG